MSSSQNQREPLDGLLVQDQQVVGGIYLSNTPEVFVEQFNQCYGPMRLQVTPLAEDPVAPPIPPGPGRKMRLPLWYRQIWRPSQTGPTQG